MLTFELGDLVSKLNIASKGHLTSIFVRRSRFSVELLSILYINGLIRGFNVQGNMVKVF
jgi:ribosomal protein S8